MNFLIKYSSVLLLLSCIINNTISQIVSNVQFRQEGDKVIINYDLETNKPVEIKIYYSTNGGLTFEKEMNNLSGEFGHNILSGHNKEVIWQPLESYDYFYETNIAFKIESKEIFFEMIFVEGGTFNMGNRNGEQDERAVHEVLLNDFYIGKYEVTQIKWKEIMGGNPSHYKLISNSDDEHPVESVSADRIFLFIEKLNTYTGKEYRLPTEAEWEYAARGGKYCKGYLYSGSDNVNDIAWHLGNSQKLTTEVGRKAPNELDIFDMSGNVWEICSDYYDPDFYSKSPTDNPKGPDSGNKFVIRGGSYLAEPRFCTVSNRAEMFKTRDRTIGFRLVLDK